MSAPFSQASAPLVFAHRGGAGLAPENTMAAFERALSLGVDGVECDVHLSRDGVPVVIHDPTLERTTSGRGPVTALTAAELAELDAGMYFEDGGVCAFRARGIGVPTLADVLDRCRGVRTIIEMKDGGAELGRAVAAVVAAAGARDRVCVGSFDRAAVETVRAVEPAIPTSASVDEVRWMLRRSWVRWPHPSPASYCALQVPERSGLVTVVTPRFIRQVHGEGRSIQVWVVDRPEDCGRLLGWGVDGLISDYPDVAIRARDEFLAARRARAGQPSAAHVAGRA